MQKKKAVNHLMKKLAKKREKEKNQLLDGLSSNLKLRLEKQKIINQMKKE